MRTTRILAPLVVAMLLVGAGCGGTDETPGQQTPGVAPPTSPPAATPEETEAEAAEPTVTVADSPHGMILVDAKGLSLYMFDPDAQGASTCYDQCATAWPPLVVSADPVAGEGADQSLLGTVERRDGSMQVTYSDWPLYHWAQDEEAGDVTGQGVNGVWWVIAPDGQPVRMAG